MRVRRRWRDPRRMPGTTAAHMSRRCTALSLRIDLTRNNSLAATSPGCVVRPRMMCGTAVVVGVRLVFPVLVFPALLLLGTGGVACTQRGNDAGMCAACDCLQSQPRAGRGFGGRAWHHVRGSNCRSATLRVQLLVAHARFGTAGRQQTTRVCWQIPRCMPCSCVALHAVATAAHSQTLSTPALTSLCRCTRSAGAAGCEQHQ